MTKLQCGYTTRIWKILQILQFKNHNSTDKMIKKTKEGGTHCIFYKVLVSTTTGQGIHDPWPLFVLYHVNFGVLFIICKMVNYKKFLCWITTKRKENQLFSTLKKKNFCLLKILFHLEWKENGMAEEVSERTKKQMTKEKTQDLWERRNV